MVDEVKGSNTLVPAIRFEGFNEAWEERKLETIFNKIRNAFVGTATPYYVTSGNFYLESNNVKDGKINRKTEIFINDEFYKKQSDKWLSAGDIVMVQSGHVGHTAVIPPELNNIAAHALIMFSNPKVPVNPYFLNFQFLTTKSKNKLAEITTGNTIKHILSSEMKEYEVSFPESEEQAKIGQYFQQLDTLIAQHQQKHDKLLNLKKSLLEKVFPKQGADEPAIRFKGFSGAWEASELGEILDIKSAARVHKNEWTSAGVPFFRTSDVVSKHKGLDNKNAFISFELYEELSSKIGYVKKDDLLITGGGSIGIPYLIKTNSPLYFKDADLLWLRNYSGINGYFLLAFFFSQSFRRYIGSITHIGTISHYTIEQAKSTPISLSTSEEQTKIGTLFQLLDTLITQHQAQLKKLTNIKQACLAKLFV